VHAWHTPELVLAVVDDVTWVCVWGGGGSVVCMGKGGGGSTSDLLGVEGPRSNVACRNSCCPSVCVETGDIAKFG
jgi:hypothetical protein